MIDNQLTVFSGGQVGVLLPGAGGAGQRSDSHRAAPAPGTPGQYLL